MKLIDVLVMISKGELKEGTIIKITDKFFTHTYTYKEGCLVDEYNAPLEEEFNIELMLNYEVELIEPEQLCKCTKKIEELNYTIERIENPTYNENWIMSCVRANKNKLNEVIRELNRRGE